jgi:hypothetical protein
MSMVPSTKRALSRTRESFDYLMQGETEPVALPKMGPLFDGTTHRTVAQMRLTGYGPERADDVSLMEKGQAQKMRGGESLRSHLPGGRAEIALREILPRVSEVAIARLACYKGLW